MPEDKKISFKFLKAEDILEGAEIKPKEIKEEKKIPSVELQKIEPKIEIKEERPKPPPVIKEKIKKGLSGIFFFKKETPQEKKIEPTPPETSKVVIPKEEKVILEPKIETQKEYVPPEEEVYLQRRKKEEEEKPKIEPKIFYPLEKEQTPQPKIGLYPKPEKEVKVEKRKTISIPKYFYLITTSLILIALIFVFKPYERFKALKKEEKEKALPSATPTLIVFPTITKEEVTKEEVLEIPTKTEVTKTEEVTKKEELVPIKKEELIFPSEEISFVKNFPEKKIEISELNFDKFKKELEILLNKQEIAGSLFYINFSFQDKQVPVDFIFDYFIKKEELKKELTGNYALILYYSYTRKNPIIIFEVKDPNKVKTINENWEKKDMANNLKTLFFGVDPGKPLTNNFLSKKFKNLSYRIIYYNNNYKIVWATLNNYLIYSATENGLTQIFEKLQ